MLKTLQAELVHRDGSARRVIRLRAIPLKRRSETYGGYVCIQLKDPHTNAAFEGRIPSGLMGAVEWGRETVFAGLVDYRAAMDKVILQFLVGWVEGTGEGRPSGKEDLLRTWQHAIDRPKPDPEAALSGERPRVAIVASTTGSAIDDIRQQCRGAEGGIELVPYQVPMTRPEEIAETIQWASLEAELVVLTGAPDAPADDLDADEIIQAIVQAPVPVVVAAGPSANVLVIARVAAQAFVTPKACGAWLRRVLGAKRPAAPKKVDAEQIREHAEVMRVNQALHQENARVLAALVAVKTEMQDRLVTMTGQLQRARWINRILALAALVAAALAGVWGMR